MGVELPRGGSGGYVRQEPRRYRIFVLGAGFSRAAGLPLAAELWREVQRRARTLTGRAEQFQDDLQTYIQYRKACDGVTLTTDQIDFEEFLAFSTSNTISGYAAPIRGALMVMKPRSSSRH